MTNPDPKLIAAMLREYAAIQKRRAGSMVEATAALAQAAALEAQTPAQPEISAGELEALERTEAFMSRLPPTDHSEATSMLGDTRTICAALRRTAQPVAQVVDEAVAAVEAIREAVQQFVEGGIDKGQAIIYITDSLKSYDFRKAANE